MKKLLLLVQDNAHELRKLKEEALTKGTDFEDAFRLTYEKPYDEASNRLTMCQLATLNSPNRFRNRTFNTQPRNSRQSRRSFNRFPNEPNVSYLVQDFSNNIQNYNLKNNGQASLRPNGGAKEK